MRVTQGAFSFLPDLTDAEIRRQIQYCLENGWAVNVEFTDDPHPRNSFWDMWNLPMFDIPDAAGVMQEINACRKVHGGRAYIRVTAFDNTHGWESVKLSFIIDRPRDEAGYALVRQEGAGRSIAYTTRAYATDKPEGERYRD
ncbi:ribulose bisphosphate carboxylase small subunit [Hyphomicrobium methylovorum]|uniref:ribulose bisphosphate carboxylase small subunit n=1 Tax=Hyphomicrobium methylovorum TaxID=84 RepID=UPI0015E65FBD|nr:ribulose bisphosphate carboxylase small subunit [Hyphomicrobium methylovorum]MBA2127438.1 ribulose bisphosphate carboxylase small subunit [Hyphomicrobium methylovorum]